MAASRAVKFVEGAANAVSSNTLPSNTDIGKRFDPDEVYENKDDAKAYEYGQTAGDIFSIILGAGEVVLGESVTVVCVVAEIPTFGTATVGVLGGQAIAVHGSLVAGSGISNLAFGKKSGKNEKHGDSGRAKSKSESQVEQLKEQLKNATGVEKKKLEQKIKNIQKDAAQKAKGEEHSRTPKR